MVSRIPLRRVFVQGLLAAVTLGFASVSGAQPAAATEGEAGPVVIAVIGDSTVMDYALSKPARGWGQLLPEFFQEGKVKVVNLSKGGRSSMSFIDEGHWDKVLALNPAPDYVLIQFGHNDMKGKGPNLETLTEPMPATLPAEGLGSQSKDYFLFNMARYIEDSQKLGAVPIVVTPMERAVFGEDGKLRRMNARHAAAAIVAAETAGITCLDLNTYSIATYTELGPDGFKHLHVQNGDNVDRSHYSEAGARLWAEWIAGQLAEQVPELAPLVVLPAADASTSGGM